MASLPRWRPAFAWLVAAGVFVMITAGGMVTTFEAGDSVPDWPLSFGEVYPERQMQGNVIYEHTHRMIGWTIGALAIALVAGLFVAQAPRGVRVVAVLALAALVTQGGLGGFRVKIMDPEFRDVLANSVGWRIEPSDIRVVEQWTSVVHAFLAEAVFCLFVGLALMTSPAFRAVESGDARRIRRLAVLTLLFLAIQVVLGSLARQTREVDWTYAHLAWAVVVLAHVAVLVGRALRVGPAPSPFRRPAVTLALLVGLQVALGLGAFLWLSHNPRWLGAPPTGAALVRTGHQAVGALIAAATCVLLLRALRLRLPVEAVA